MARLSWNGLCKPSTLHMSWGKPGWGRKGQEAQWGQTVVQGSWVPPALGGDRRDTVSRAKATWLWKVLQYHHSFAQPTSPPPHRSLMCHKGLGQEHASPRHYRGHPQPPLFLPGSRPQSQLSSPSCGWHGLACSTHLGARRCEHCPPGLLSAHQGQYTPGLMAPLGQRAQGRTHHGCKGLMLRAWMNCVPRAWTPPTKTQGGIPDPEGMIPLHPRTLSSPCAGSNISTVLTKWGRE